MNVYWWGSLLLMLLISTACEHDASNYAIKGIDVSHYQGQINWDVVDAQKELQFVFIKATEGVSYRDSIFKRNWEQAGKTHLRRGAYHFFRPSVSVEWQIKNFIKQVQLTAGDLPPVLDVEDVDHIPPEVLIPKVEKWLIFIEEHYGIRPILYASLNLYQKVLQPAFPDHIAWIARYNSTAPPAITQWDFWQYSDQSYINGIDHKVDMNVFKGSLSELEGLCLPE